MNERQFFGPLRPQVDRPDPEKSAQPIVKAPQQRLQHDSFGAETQVLPLRLLVVALAATALVSSDAYAKVSGGALWTWLAAVIGVVVARYLFATAPVHSSKSVSEANGLRWLAGAYMAEVGLWLALLGLLWPFAVPLPTGVLYAAYATLALGVSALRAHRGLLVGWLLGWVLVLALVVAADGGRSPALVFGLGGLLVSLAWYGLSGGSKRVTADAVSAQNTSGPPGQFGATRLGWNAAVRAIPTPVIVCKEGRVVEINASACQFIGAEQAELIGRPLEDYIAVHPAGALDSLHPAVRDLAAVQVRPLRKTTDAQVWHARLRFLDPGRGDTTVVISLIQPSPDMSSANVRAKSTRAAVPVPIGRTVHEDAQRLAEWIGGNHGRPWWRDETGHLHLPPEFKLPPATLQGEVVTAAFHAVSGPQPHPATGAVASAANLVSAQMALTPATDLFPLAHLVEPAERPGLDARYAEHVRAGRIFDERVRLRNAGGGLRAVRVVCFQRNVQPARTPLVIGVIAPIRSELAHVLISPGDVVGHLPALVWVVDAAGRVVHAHTGPGGDPRRWGLRVETGTTPIWSDAIDFFDSSHETVLKALRGALSGRPTFDLLNHRTGSSGGRIALRSHVVPFVLSGDTDGSRQGAMVLDTIASAQELMENERLRRSKSQYKALVEASPSLIWAIDAQLRFTFLSKRACRETYGFSVGEMIGNPFSALLEPSVDQFATTQALEALREGQSLRGFEIVKRAKNGQRLLVSVSAATLKAPDGSFAGAIGMSVDLTGLKQRERRLSEALRIERMVLDSAGQAIAVVKDGRVARCNDAFVQLLRVEPAELARLPVAQFFADTHDWLEICAVAEERRAADRAATREVRMVRHGRAAASGSDSAWCQLTARSIAAGEYVLVLTDIDTIRRREAHALHDAQHDELTGLPNRRLFSERCAEAMAQGVPRGMSCAVIVIDLDGFKAINDMHGHRVGDAVLREIASRLSRAMRPQDTVARRGGDEFAVLMPDAGARADIESIAERILREVEQPVELAGNHFGQLSASMGIALAPEHGRDIERLLQLADHAMYEAKVSGKNTWAFASNSGHSATVTPIGARALRGG